MPRAWRGRDWYAGLAVYAVAFVILDRAAVAFQLRPQDLPAVIMLPTAISPWHLGLGLHLAVLLWGGWRAAPVVFLVQVLSTLAGTPMLSPGVWLTLLSNAALITVSYLAMAYLLTRMLGVGLRLQRPPEVFRYVGVVVPATALLGVLFVCQQAGYLRLDHGWFGRLWLNFWIGHMTALLTVTPALLSTGLPLLRGAPRWWRRPSRRAVAEGLGWLVLTVLVCGGSVLLEKGTEFRLLYLTFVPMLWAALRLGVPGAAMAGVLMNTLALVLVLQYVDRDFPTTALQGFMAALGGTGLVVGAAADLQRQARRDFQSLVEHSLQAVVILQGGRIAFANRQTAEITGYPVADLLRLEPEAVMALVAPEDQARVRHELGERLAEDGGQMMTASTTTLGQLTFQLLRRDGARRHLIANAVLATYHLRPALQVALLDNTERHLAKLARDAEEWRTNQALAGSQVGLWDWELASKQVVFHRHWAEILGYAPGEIKPVEQMWEQCTHADDRAGVQRQLEAHLAGKTAVYEAEVRMRARAGDWRWILLRGRVVERDAQGQPRRLCGVHMDITERRQVEAAWRDSQEELSAIIAALPDLVIVATPDGVMESVFAADPGMLMVPADQVLGHRFQELLPPAVVLALEAAAGLALISGKVQQCEYELPLRGGTRWFNGRVVRFQAHGEPRVLWVVHDITERRHADSELRRLSERLELALAGAGIGMWDWNVATGELALSDRVATMLGYDPGDLQPHWDTWEDLVHPADLPHVRATWETHVSGQATLWEAEQRMRRRDGTYAWLLSRGRAVAWGDDGRPLRATGTFLDIGDRKRAEEERGSFAEQAVRMEKLKSLGMLAGGVAHDFNNLLMVILGNADLARLDLPAESPVRDYLAEITTAGKRAAELSRQMLAYAGRSTMKIEVLQLSDLVQDMTDLLAASLSKKIIFKQRLTEYLPPIEADAAQVRQILLNLLSNASEAIGENEGLVTISTGVMQCDDEYLNQGFLNEQLPPGLYVYLEVTDTGCGMDEATRSQLFDPFFTTKFPGRGLGLASVLGMVRSHHGTIVVASEEGRGSTFTVLFPAVEDNSPVHGDKVTESGSWIGHGVVLLADDEDGVRTVAKLMLEKLGFTVITAPDGHAAVEAYRANQHRIVCCILDFSMPGLNGEEAFNEILRLNPAARVLIASGYTDADTEQRFAGHGLRGFIQKPYQFSTLKHLLWKITEGK